MRPRTLSASALNTADLCLARYKAENIDYTPADDSTKVAANVGTACHYALEKYVEAVYMKRAAEPSLDLLLMYFHAGYLETFDTVEYKTPEYDDGVSMLKTWFTRTDLSGVTVMSVEQKRRFPLPTSVGDIPLTYIWDRCDIFTDAAGRRVCRVVDYKTIRAQVGHDELRGKLQARIYDLMARVQFKDENIDEFQVIFDLLRHEPVGVIFSREEATDTWNALKARAERILETSYEHPPESLNPECAYCIRKLECKTLRKHVEGGGMFSVQNINHAVAMRYDIANQIKGLTAALEELDKIILTYAEQQDETEFLTDDEDYGVKVYMSKRRVVDVDSAAPIIGPDLMRAYAKLNVSDVDKLIKEGTVSGEAAVRLAATVTSKLVSTNLKITKKK